MIKILYDLIHGTGLAYPPTTFEKSSQAGMSFIPLLIYTHPPSSLHWFGVQIAPWMQEYNINNVSLENNFVFVLITLLFFRSFEFCVSEG